MDEMPEFVKQFLSSGKVEPSGNAREAASHLWQYFVALREVGFSEDQAFAIILTIVSNN